MQGSAAISYDKGIIAYDIDTTGGQSGSPIIRFDKAEIQKEDSMKILFGRNWDSLSRRK